jgi:hypothetical protein
MKSKLVNNSTNIIIFKTVQHKKWQNICKVRNNIPKTLTFIFLNIPWSM